MLRLNGYSTGAFGKWHETAAWETSVSGPFDRWPTHQGFDKFYGFIGGETDQWYPLIDDGVKKIDPPKMKNYHFSVDMTNQTINWIKAQQSMTPDKPFFVYYATGAVHAPHHVPKEWADKYKGQFDKGWDQVRIDTLARQKKLGLVPANTTLPGRPEDLKAWQSLPEDQRRLFARQAEVFAGFLEHTDDQVGRLKKALEDINEFDNTLFIYIAGDNGTSAEGGFDGMYNEMTYFNGVAEKVEDLIPLVDKWGGPDTFPHMAAGWAVAFDTPFKWTKQVASDFGGTRNGVVISWPKGIKEKGGCEPVLARIDIAPTVLEAAGIPSRRASMAWCRPARGQQSRVRLQRRQSARAAQGAVLRDVRQPRHLQRGLVRRTIHRAPWQTTNLPPLTTDKWELYNAKNDFALTNNLAAKEPERLKQMQALFMSEAQKYNVLPIDDRTIERTNPTLAGRPDVLGDRKSLTLYEGMEGMLENTFMNIKNRSSKVTAKLDVPAGASGAILAQGGKFGGWSLYMKDGKPAYTYNFLGLSRYTVTSPNALPAGSATVVADFAYDGGGAGKGGKADAVRERRSVAEGRVEKTQPNIFSADETADVGIDNQTPVAVGHRHRCGHALHRQDRRDHARSEVGDSCVLQ